MSHPYSSEAICETIDALEKEIERLRCEGMKLASERDRLLSSMLSQAKEIERLSVDVKRLEAENVRLIAQALPKPDPRLDKLRAEFDAAAIFVKPVVGD